MKQFSEDCSKPRHFLSLKFNRRSINTLYQIHALPKAPVPCLPKDRINFPILELLTGLNYGGPIHKGAPVMKHPRSTLWTTNPTERSAYKRDQQPEKAGACGKSTFSGYKQAPISSRRYQSMCFNNLINSWSMSSLFSRRI